VIRPFNNVWPRIHPTAYVDPQAVIIGDVVIEENTSVWPYAVIRGDISKISIGKETAIEDGVLIHGGGRISKLGAIEPIPVVIGNNCIIGHGAVIHSCTIKDFVLIGMRAIIGTGAIIEEGSIVAMGSVVREGMRVPPRTLVAGVPARPIRQVTDDDYQVIIKSSQYYAELARKHKELLHL